MPRVPEPDGAEGTPFYRVMGYHPTILEKFVTLRDAYWEEGVLEHSLKELVRMLSATLNTCEHCKAVRTAWSKRDGLEDEKVAEVGNYADRPDLFSARERAALEFTRSFFYKLGWVEDAVMEDAKQQFSSAEIVELAFCLWQFMGGNWFMHALGVEPEDDIGEYYGGSKSLKSKGPTVDG